MPLFVSFSTRHRWTLPPGARDVALATLKAEHNRKAQFQAAVVMPNHVHAVFSPLRDSNGEFFTLPEIIHAIKGSSAWQINHLLGRKGPVWEEECFDRLPRNSENLWAKIAYVLQNPVRKGLVKRWQDYPWSWWPDLLQP